MNSAGFTCTPANNTDAKKVSAAWTFTLVGLLHLVGLALLAYGLTSGSPTLAASALIAYTLGLRHALDADHICMIDNSTRKFVAELQVRRAR